MQAAYVQERERDEIVDDYFEAAGFVPTPDECEATPLSATALCEALLAVADQPVPAESIRAAEVVDAAFGENDVLRVYEPDVRCEVLVITFGSLTLDHAGRRTHADAQFEFVGTLRRLRVTHALHVRDRQQSWFLRGGRTATNGRIGEYEALLALLRRERDDLGAPAVVTVGQSMGGYAAIRAAIGLGARASVAFGPQVFLRPESRALLELPWQVCEIRLATMRAGGGTPMASLVDTLHAAAEEAAGEAGERGVKEAAKAAEAQEAAAEDTKEAEEEAAKAEATTAAEAEAAAAEAVVEAAEAAAAREAAGDAMSVGDVPLREGAAAPIEVYVHVGAWAKGDLKEAYLLQAAAAASSAAPSAEESSAAVADARGADGTASAATGEDGAACRVHVHVHERAGHVVASDLRERGLLDALLGDIIFRGTLAGTESPAGRGAGGDGTVGSPPPVAPRPLTLDERLARVRARNANGGRPTFTPTPPAPPAAPLPSSPLPRRSPAPQQRFNLYGSV